MSKRTMQEFRCDGCGRVEQRRVPKDEATDPLPPEWIELTMGDSNGGLVESVQLCGATCRYDLPSLKRLVDEALEERRQEQGQPS